MTKNCFIYETLESVKTLKISKEDGLMTLSGVFGVCGVRNNNRRVYEAKNYGKMVTEMKSRIKTEGGIPGELEHPSTMNVTLENISHKITDINIDENGVVTGTIALLDTPKGKIAQAIVEGGLPLFISSRATGNVDKSGSVMLERIATYDLVGTPGFSQAKLHLNENQIAESINESLYYIYENNNENNIDDMDLKEILEKLETLEDRVSDLEYENETLREQLEESGTAVRMDEGQIQKLANGIQKWIVEEYSSTLEKWIMEEYSPEAGKMNESQTEEITKRIQKWIAEEYSPALEKWIMEEYSPEVENWAKTELAEGIQKWIVEEYSPEVETWLTESYSEKINDQISESIKESKQTDLDSVGEVLNILESFDGPKKPTYSGSSLIVESLANINEPAYIKEMPADVRVKYNMASQEVKESIARRAKLYNFTTEGAIERFWSRVDFDNIKPSKNVYEGLNQIMDERERAIRGAIRKFKFNR